MPEFPYSYPDIYIIYILFLHRYTCETPIRWGVTSNIPTFSNIRQSEHSGCVPCLHGSPVLSVTADGTAAAVRPPECKDCIATGVSRWRAIAPGCGSRTPLCVTHKRERKKTRSARAHELRLGKQYGITAQQYWALYEFQGGLCAVCGRAKGKSKRLAVEHDHDVAEYECGHARDVGCPNCIRCLSCGQCNELLGRYPVAALRRAIKVLTDPPARRFFRGEVK